MSVAYFASDFHLGAPDQLQSKARELAIVSWLEYASQDATDIYLVGDVFDFWFEYKRVIPKGYARLFGTIARLSDQGIQFHFFYGNHDMWVKSYFKEEFNMKIHAEPITLNLFGKKMLVGHGDGLGPGDRGYKLIKPILRSPLCQWAFARLHPNFGIGLASFFHNSNKTSVKNNGNIKEMHKIGSIFMLIPTNKVKINTPIKTPISLLIFRKEWFLNKR